MMTNDWKPKIGDLIHVRTEYPVAGATKKYVLSGKVIASARHDHKGTFRLYTGNPKFPISVIAMERVTGIKLREVA